MATSTEIIDSVQEIFGDTREVAFTRLQCLRWLSDGQQQIAKDTECVTQTTTFDITTVGLLYDGHVLPTSPAFIREATVEWKGTPLKKIQREDLNAFQLKLGETTSSEPTHYFIFQERLWVWPYPASADSTDPLRLWYYAMPATLTLEATALTIPVVLHNDLIDYCLARARERNEDPEQAGRSMQAFTERMAQSREILFNPHGESYPVVRSDPGDWF